MKKSRKLIVLAFSMAMILAVALTHAFSAAAAADITPGVGNRVEGGNPVFLGEYEPEFVIFKDGQIDGVAVWIPTGAIAEDGSYYLQRYLESNGPVPGWFNTNLKVTMIFQGDRKLLSGNHIFWVSKEADGYYANKTSGTISNTLFIPGAEPLAPPMNEVYIAATVEALQTYINEYYEPIYAYYDYKDTVVSSANTLNGTVLPDGFTATYLNNGMPYFKINAATLRGLTDGADIGFALSNKSGGNKISAAWNTPVFTEEGLTYNLKLDGSKLTVTSPVKFGAAVYSSDKVKGPADVKHDGKQEYTVTTDKNGDFWFFFHVDAADAHYTSTTTIVGYKLVREETIIEDYVGAIEVVVADEEGVVLTIPIPTGDANAPAVMQSLTFDKGATPTYTARILFDGTVEGQVEFTLSDDDDKTTYTIDFGTITVDLGTVVIGK